MKQPEVCVWLTEITVLMVKIYRRKESEDQNVVFSALGSVLYFAAPPQLKIVLLIN